jgi:O-antigen/teichoic acid export membrane protein
LTHQRKADLAAILFLTFLPLLWFGPVVLGGRTLLPADNLFAFEPWRSFAATQGITIPHNELVSDLILENYAWKTFIHQSIRDRQLPLWNPYLFAGVPFLAAGQHSALYPLSIVFYILPLWLAYGVFTWLQMALSSLAMYAFARTLRLRPGAATLAAIAYTFSLFFVVSVTFPMIIAAASWLPLVLTAIEIMVHKQEEKGNVPYSPVPYVVIGSLAVGLSVLAGHAEMLYYVLLTAGFYAFWRLLACGWLLRVWRPVLRLGIWLLVMVALGLGLGAAQLLPLYELVKENFRQGSVGYEQVVGWAYPTRQVITFLIPDFFGNPTHHGYWDVVSHQRVTQIVNAAGEPVRAIFWGVKNYVEAGSYVGLLSLLLAALAVLDARRAARRTHLRLFVALAILSLLFAFGTPLYALLFYGLPGYKQLHSAFRWVFPYTLAMAALAGMGAERLLPRPPPGSAGLPSPQVLKGGQFYAEEVERVSPTDLSPPSAPSSLRSGERRSGEEKEGYKPAFYSQQTSSSKNGLPLNPPQSEGGEAAKHPAREGGGPSLLVLAALGLGILVLLFVAMGIAVPGPFVHLGDRVLAEVDLARGAFADGRAFWSYQAINLLRFGGLLALSGAALLWARRRKRMGAPALIAVLIFDLWLYGHGFFGAARPAWLSFRPPVVSFLLSLQTQQEPWRFTTFIAPGEKTFNANVGMFYGLEDIRGYDSIIPRQYVEFMERIEPQDELLYNRVAPLSDLSSLDSPLLHLLGVRYLLTTQTIVHSGWTLVYDNEVKVYRNERAVPRAFVVHSAQVMPPAWVSESLTNFDLRRTVLLADRDAPATYVVGCQDCAPSSQPAIVSYKPNEVVISATLDRPGWLVLTDSYFSGWRAYDNEREVPILRANGAFRAVQLEAGTHTVRFRYSPMSVRLGFYGSFLAAMTLALLAGAWAWGKFYREAGEGEDVRRVAKNSLVPMLASLVNKGIDFAFALLRLRILSPVGEGSYTFAIVFIGYFEIFSRFGLGTLLTREVAKDRARANRYFANTVALRTVLWLASLPLMLLAGLLYVRFGSLSRDEALAIALFAIALFFANIADAISAAFNAYEKMEYPAGLSTGIALGKVALGALVLLWGWGFVGLSGVSVVMNMVQVTVLLLLMRQHLFTPHMETDAAFQREMLVTSFPLMINHLLATVFFRVDVLILKPLKGEATVGLYGAAYKFIDGLNVIPAYFTLAIFPIMSRLAQSARDSLMRAYILSLRLLLMVSLPVAVATTFLAEPLILILGGAQYLPASRIALQILIWSIPIGFINSVTQYVLIAIDQQRFLTRAFVIGVTFNLVANLLFIPRYSYQAAAVNTILSEIALLLPFYYCLRQNLGRIPWGRVAWQPAAAAGAMALTMGALQAFSLLLALFVGGTVYLIGLVAVGTFRDADLALVLGKLSPLARVQRLMTER